MISTMEHLTKRAFTQRVNNLITISQMIVIDNKIVASFIIIAVIICGTVGIGRFLLASGAYTVYRGIIQNFLALIE